MLRRNVLIFHQAALGDFIVTWPLAMALSRIWAQSRIIYVTHSQKGKLAERVIRVESVDSEVGWHGLFAEEPSLPETQQRLLDSAQMIVSFTAGEIDRLGAGVAKLAPEAKVISINTKLDHPGHVTESIAMQLVDAPLAEGMRQMLRSVASRGTGFSRNAGKDIVVHPGAGKEANRWPAERFLELIRRLNVAARPVRVLLGDAELERWPRQAISLFEAAATIRRPATLLDLLTELSTAAAFVGNDSGPGHLAGIIGVPTVSIFGASDPVRWRPIGPTVSVLQHTPISELAVDCVFSGLDEVLRSTSA